MSGRDKKEGLMRAAEETHYRLSRIGTPYSHWNDVIFVAIVHVLSQKILTYSHIEQALVIILREGVL